MPYRLGIQAEAEGCHIDAIDGLRSARVCLRALVLAGHGGAFEALRHNVAAERSIVQANHALNTETTNEAA